MPKCDMEAGCQKPVTMIDSSGWLYCTEHGKYRQQFKNCRKLRTHELNRIKRGQPIERY